MSAPFTSDEPPPAQGPTAPQCASLTSELPVELLQRILGSLLPHDLMKSTQVSGAMAAACEPAFQDICMRRGWRYPRRPRNSMDAPAAHVFPWRALYFKHGCRSCGAVGEFPLRSSGSSVQLFLMCRKCLGLPSVQKRMIQQNLTVDTLSLEGRRLLRQPTKQRRGLRHSFALRR